MNNIIQTQTQCPVSHNSKHCLIYESSLKFCRTIYAILVLISFLLHNQWLLLATVILMFLRIFSIKLDFPYQFHALFLRKLLKDKSEPLTKETSELNFVFGIMTSFLLAGFLFIYFGKFVDFVWIFVLITDLLMFLAAFVGFCLATMIYVFFKKLRDKKK
ncbi:MAG: DUF4395 family protein [bacterium]|nr:DUF4395 family protein [bacterium]